MAGELLVIIASRPSIGVRLNFARELADAAGAAGDDDRGAGDRDHRRRPLLRHRRAPGAPATEACSSPDSAPRPAAGVPAVALQRTPRNVACPAGPAASSVGRRQHPPGGQVRGGEIDVRVDQPLVRSTVEAEEGVRPHLDVAAMGGGDPRRPPGGSWPDRWRRRPPGGRSATPASARPRWSRRSGRSPGRRPIPSSRSASPATRTGSRHPTTARRPPCARWRSGTTAITAK